MEDKFAPIRKFLNHIHKIMVRKIKEGKCNGKVIRWREQ